MRLAILAGTLLVLAGASPAFAQREVFLGALRAVAAATQPNRPDRTGALRRAAGRMRDALAAWDRSIAELESRAARQGATSAGAFQLHVQLGIAYRTRGRLADALHEFDTALALQPSSSDLQILRALTFESMGRPADASRAFEEAWTDDPTNPVKAYYVAERTSGQYRVRARAALIGAYGQFAQGDSKDSRRVQQDPPQRPFVMLDPIPDDL
ncbi:MAG: tetratricopeptide repeat protein, partial [Deltaproteobacteria bacterium]